MAASAHPAARPSHRVESPRLVMRTPVPSDATAIASLLSTEKNHPYTAMGPAEPEKYLPHIEKWPALAASGERALMIITLHSGQTIGFGGFNEFRWVPALELGAEKVLEADLGVMLDHQYWGKGYGREAVAALVEYALQELGAEHISIDTVTDNKPWQLLMHSMGLGPLEEIRPAVHGRKEGDQEWLYQFGQGYWGNAKEEMKAKNKWPL